jgi:hypothetical protein
MTILSDATAKLQAALDARFRDNAARMAAVQGELITLTGEQEALTAVLAHTSEPVVEPALIYEHDDDFSAWKIESKIGAFNNQDMYRRAGGPYQQGINTAKTHPDGRPQYAVLEVTDSALVRFVVDPRDMDAVIAENERLGITGSGIKCKITKDARVQHDVFEANDGDIVETGIRAFIRSSLNPWAVTHTGASPRLFGSGTVIVDADNKGGNNCDMRVSTDGPGNTFSLNRRNFDHGASYNISGGDMNLDRGRPGYAPVEPPVDRWFDLMLRYRVGTTVTNAIKPLDKSAGEPWMELLLDGEVILAANCGTRGFNSHPLNQGEFGMTHTGAAGELLVDNYFIRIFAP